MSFTSPPGFAPGFAIGVVICSVCIRLAHLYLSPQPVDGKWYDIFYTLVFGLGVVAVIMYFYLRKNQDKKEVSARGTMEVALEPTDETGNNFSQFLATRKCPPLHITVERDGRFLDMSFSKVTACTAHTLDGLMGPYRLVVSDGMIIVAERDGDCVKEMKLDGSIIKTIGVGQMKKPGGVALDSRGNIYVTSNHKLQKFSVDGELLKDVGSRRAGIENSEFDTPRGIVVDDQKVYVCDSLNGRIQVFDLNLNFVKNLISDVKDPQDIAFDRESNEIYVCEKGMNRISVLNGRGKKLRYIGEPERGSTIRLNDPHGIHIYDKYILVSAESINGIAVYDTSGKYLTSITEFRHPRGITSDENGLIYFCEFSKERIVVI